VYYEDTDAGGIVYHANYLKFMERARTEWVRSLGLHQNNLLEQSIGFVVIDMSIGFKLSAKLDDLLLVTCKVKQLKRASIVFEQSVSKIATSALVSAQDLKSEHEKHEKHEKHQKHQNNNQTLVVAEVKVACVNIQTQKPMAIPPNFLREMRSDV